jgi:hypothetical protein
MLHCLNYLLGVKADSMKALFGMLSTRERKYTVSDTVWSARSDKGTFKVIQEIYPIGVAATLEVKVEHGYHATVTAEQPRQADSPSSILPLWNSWTSSTSHSSIYSGISLFGADPDTFFSGGKSNPLEAVLAPIIATNLAYDTQFFNLSEAVRQPGTLSRHATLALYAGSSHYAGSMHSKIQWLLTHYGGKKYIRELALHMIPVGSPDARSIADFVLRSLPNEAVALLDVVKRARFPLHVATDALHIGAIRELLAQGYDPNVVDEVRVELQFRDGRLIV